MDFTKIENIIFVSVLGALCALFLAAVIAVGAKGKRKCRAIDVVLRIFAVLVFIAAAVLFTCSIMIDLSGSFRIDLGDADAVMVVGGWSYGLPLVPLFAALATIVGRYLALGLAVLALLALIVDCALANKKDKKNIKAAVKKSPEQIKREQDIERIRKLANAAVEKSNTAVAAGARSENAPKSNDDDQNVQSDNQENYTADWRVDSDDRKHNEFVGIHESDVGDSFDTFDDVSEDKENAEDTVREEWEQSVSEAEDTSEDDNAEELDQALEEAADETNDEVTDEIPFYAEGSYVPEEDEQVEADESVEDSYSDTVEESKRQEFTRPTEDTARGEYEEYSAVNRDFYIPDVRTYERRPEPEKPAPTQEKTTPKKSTAAQSKKSGSTARKASAAKKSTTSTSAKKTEEKPTNANNGSTKKPSKTTSGDKLPVTRRYVIINRTNAVNAFSEYIKERDKAEKDKLTSSINKIIIK